MERGVRPIGDWSMSMTLSSCSSPSNPLHAFPESSAHGSAFLPVSYTGSHLPATTLTGTGYTGHTGKYAQSGTSHRYFSDYFPGHPLPSIQPVGCRRSFGTGICNSAAQIRSRHTGFLILHQILSRAKCPRPLHRVLRLRDRYPQHSLLHALYPHHAPPRYSELPRSRSLHKRCQQLVIVPLVQTDTWLIQNISNPNQTGTDLGCQTDTLGLAAGQAYPLPGQGSDNPGPHPSESQHGHGSPLRSGHRSDAAGLSASVRSSHSIRSSMDRHGHLVDIFTADGHSQRVLPSAAVHDRPYTV